MQRHALVDLDGTLADYDGALMLALEQMRAPCEPPLTWLDRKNEPTWMQARRRLVTTQPGFWVNLPPLAAGFEVYRALREIGFHTHILSKGPTSKENAWGEKKLWCSRHVPESPVHIVEDKSISYGRVLVDDWPEYISPWLESRPRGLVVMPAQPWNRDFTHPQVYRYEGDQDRLKRVLLAAYYRESGEPLSIPD